MDLLIREHLKQKKNAWPKLPLLLGEGGEMGRKAELCGCRGLRKDTTCVIPAQHSHLSCCAKTSQNGESEEFLSSFLLPPSG